MSFLLETFLGNTVLQWLLASVLIALIMLAFWLVQSVLIRRFQHQAAPQPGANLTALIHGLIRDIRWWVVFVIALYAGSLLLKLPDVLSVDVLPTLAIIAGLVQAAFWGDQFIRFLLGRYIRSRSGDEVDGDTAYNLLQGVLRFVLWVLIVLMIIENLPGVEITPLLAGLGVGSVAVALAVQNILSDLFASLSIVLDKPFVVGDSIEVDTFSGTVENIGLKTTRVRSTTGEELVFSNSDLLGSRIRNYRRMNERRAVIELRVAYDTPIDKLEALPALIEQEISSVDLVRFDRAHLKTLSDFALIYEIVYWVLVPDYRTYMDTLQEINLRLLNRLEQERIEIPFSRDPDVIRTSTR
ncbi:MAG TPA: mechanosensitive ion channel family protein [Aggregatilineales bacterium]|nr:mechanosensitive ion channel family protein [Aggregatilineales bacterium]